MYIKNILQAMLETAAKDFGLDKPIGDGVPITPGRIGELKFALQRSIQRKSVSRGREREKAREAITEMIHTFSTQHFDSLQSSLTKVCLHIIAYSNYFLAQATAVDETAAKSEEDEVKQDDDSSAAAGDVKEEEVKQDDESSAAAGEVKSEEVKQDDVSSAAAGDVKNEEEKQGDDSTPAAAGDVEMEEESEIGFTAEDPYLAVNADDDVMPTEAEMQMAFVDPEDID